MKKNILTGIFVFIFSFVALFLALDNRQETYAKLNISMDSRFNDLNFYTCVRNAVGESNILSDGVTIKTSALENLTTLKCLDKNIISAKGLALMKNLQELIIHLIHLGKQLFILLHIMIQFRFCRHF